MPTRPRIRLPTQWPEHVKSGILHAISLASVIVTYARGRATSRSRLRTQLDQANNEIALLREELSIKDGRWEPSRLRRRQHCTPTQRLRILQLLAARGWTLEKTSRVFLLDLPWAELMRRVFAVDVLICPRCSGGLRILATIHPPATTKAILECLDLSTRPPPLAPANPSAGHAATLLDS